MEDKSKRFDIGIITSPFNDIVGEAILIKFIKIFEPLSNTITVITGIFPENVNLDNKIYIKHIKYGTQRDSIPVKILKYILMQLEVSYHLLKMSKNFDILIFFIGGSAFILPMITAKLLRKKTVLIVTGSLAKKAKKSYLNDIMGILEQINFILSNYLVVETKSAISFIGGLEKHSKKIFDKGAMYTDINIFKVERVLKEREMLVGYIGRLSESKGTIDFVKAMPIISKANEKIKFLIVGGGQLHNEIEKYLNEKKINNNVKLAGEISHDKIPAYLNRLKLLVLPSYSEGLPNIVLEAMACGTPVLATPVGGVPDVIKDGETGFILENNSPECIAKNVIRALEHPKLDEIVKKARELIEKEYTYEAAVKRYKKILEELRYDE